ncbi:thioesterase II family protein [Streptomyces sp. NPDC003090]|uniref:thioesterase II family protein n=1 Tax=unclassified Streptomyces TaxID=2593676 RepID=UPI00381071BB
MPRSTTAPRWLVRRRERPETEANLYVFAHAGGSAGEYLRMWADDLPGLTVWGVQLPGRSARLAEPAYRDLRALVDDLVEQAPFTGPCAFFGHSFGALLAYETARALHRAGRAPGRLVLSSCPPPHVIGTGRRDAPMAELPDDELIAAVEERWGPLSDQVHDDPRLRRLVLGPLRADIGVLESYTPTPGPPLPVPTTLVCGTDEEGLGLDGWSRHLDRVTDRIALPGGHFHFRADPAPLLDVVRDATGSLTPTEQTGAPARWTT